MDKDALISKMITLLVGAIEAEEEASGIEVHSSAPLVGGEAILSSMSLVSYIMDVESELEADYGLEVTLVNESALSRELSPFRTVETLADYILELAGNPSPAAI